jgi:quercetin 2,3-dioxygenase
MNTLKKVVAVRKAPPIHWVGDGFAVHSMFSYDESPELFSPFLLLDYAAPRTFAPSEARRGVGEHPHRGFETVTIVYQGDVEHRDSTGTSGRLGPGDVQWMTAASGVVHEEMHGPLLTEKGGTMQMAQLWINLPARDKMSAPRYQDLLHLQIPSVALPGDAGALRVIAGEYRATRGPARTFTPVNLWDLRLKAGKGFDTAIPEGHTTLVLVLEGALEVDGPSPLGAAELAVFSRSGDRLSVKATTDATLLVLSGQPIDEPVVGYGPFVMNTEKEIRTALSDYQNGKMGSLS